MSDIDWKACRDLFVEKEDQDLCQRSACLVESKPLAQEVLQLKEKLCRQVKFDVELVINENRSTMLNVLSRKKDFAKLSIHKMFLQAPDEVISAVAHYVKGVRREKKADSLRIRSFIQKNLELLDYSADIDRSKCVTKGEVYDLQEIFDTLNAKYYDNRLDLAITWYGKRGRKNKSRIIFGQYFDHLRLIKMHRLLDDPFFPPFFVHFVMYHEMLHHVVPGQVDHNGYFRSHGRQFKDREKEFADYEKAMLWEKEHKEELFMVV